MATDKLADFRHIPGAEKVDLGLLELAVKAPPKSGSLAGIATAPTKGAQGVLLEVFTRGNHTAAVEAIGKFGVGIVSNTPQFNNLLVDVATPDQLVAIAALEDVASVSAFHAPARAAGRVVSGAEYAHRARAGSDKYNGVDGSGVTVGVLSDSFNTSGLINQPGTTRTVETLTDLEYTAPAVAGRQNYTLVVETSEPTEITLVWTSSSPIEASTTIFPIEEVNCRSRIPLTGTGETLSRLTTRELIGYPSSSCSGGATSFALFGFSIPEGQANDLFFQVIPTGEVEATISLRASCTDLSTELACSIPRTIVPPVLTRLANQDSGDLPPTVTVIKEYDRRGGDEGAAMAEIIHDVAPGANIVFHTAFISESDFAQGILKLAGVIPVGEDENGGDVYTYCDVIVDDVIWFTEPLYQRGLVQLAVETAVQGTGAYRKLNAVNYYSAAGNFANNAIREYFRDVDGADDTMTPPTGKDLHKWSATGNGYLPVDIPPGGTLTAYLQWNQPWERMALATGSPLTNACRIDMDLLIVKSPDRAGLDEVFSFEGISEGRLSKQAQGAGFGAAGNPFEAVSYTNRTGTTQKVYLVVDHYDGNQDRIPQANEELQFTVLFRNSEGVRVKGVDPEDPNSGGPTIWGHMLAEGAVAVGAVNYFDTPSFDVTYGPTNEIDPEDFTAKGGEFRQFFDEFGGVSLRSTYAPTLAGADGVNTTFFVDSAPSDFDLDTFPNFFGTSAAAPSLAGVAALIKSMNRSLNPGQITAAMVDTAVDVKGYRAKQGKDDTTGFGLVDAFAAMDYVAEAYGVGTGPGSVTQLVWDFADASGWTFASPPQYDSPVASTPVGGLSLRATSNDCFGWWESPELAASAFQIPGVTTISGSTAANSLYRLTWTVSTNNNERSTTPAFRIRTGSKNFEQTSEMMVTAVGSGTLSPRQDKPGRYIHHFELPPSQKGFRLYFDIMSFDGDDNTGATLTLEQVILDVIDPLALTGSSLESLALFSDSRRNGWTARNGGSSMGRIDAKSGSRGLELGPTQNGDRVSFGFWASPEDNPPARLRPSRLYRATFSVSSPLAANERLKLPPFRLRMNSGNNQMSSVVMISSTVDSAPLPTGDTLTQYRLWFQSPPELDAAPGDGGEPVNLSIDYIYAPGIGDKSSAVIRLEGVRLDSFLAPISF